MPMRAKRLNGEEEHQKFSLFLPLNTVLYSYYQLPAFVKIRNIAMTFIFIAIVTGSCSKNLPECTGNCDLITFSGDVTDPTSGNPVSSQMIQVILKAKGFCLCYPTNIASGSSDAQGHFEFKKEMDTTYLRDHYLEADLTTSDNYVTRAVPADSSAGKLYHRISALYFSVIDSSLSQMKFKIYPKASLRVNLHRITPIISGREFFDIDFSLTGDTRNGEPFVMTEANKDTFVLVNTAANVFTNIHSSKFITYDSAVNKIDSIKCVLNGNNSIDISF